VLCRLEGNRYDSVVDANAAAAADGGEAGHRHGREALRLDDSECLLHEHHLEHVEDEDDDGEAKLFKMEDRERIFRSLLSKEPNEA